MRSQVHSNDPRARNGDDTEDDERRWEQIQMVHILI